MSEAGSDEVEASALEIVPVRRMPEVRPGDDLAEMIATRLEEPLRASDVVVVTSKVVSKALGLVSHADREALAAESTERVVARRGVTRIVRTKQGLTMAAAGVDASNTELGTAIALPSDPDAEAAALRGALMRLYPAAGTLGVVITDTAGRAWRLGQTDLAIGCSGLWPMRSYEGERDAYGNELRVTAPAIADEIAAATDLVTGKVSGLPVAVVRGLAREHFHPGDGPGAAALIRDDAGDLFGLGANEAVRLAVGTEHPRGFADLDDDVVGLALAPVDADVLSVDVSADAITVTTAAGAERSDSLIAYGALYERLRILDRAYGTSHCARLRLGK